jgi:hypothetical protein
MTEPRIYQVILGEGANTGKALAVARQFLAASGKPADGISVWASLAPSTVAVAASLLPGEILSADITLEPGALGVLAKVLGDEPRGSGWFLVQRASVFGASLGVGTPHPSQWQSEGGDCSTVWFDFGGDPVPEAIENGRFGRWLADLASVGLLPPSVSPAALMKRFASAFGPRRAGQDLFPKTTPVPGPLLLDGGVRVSARGSRVMRGDRGWHWPGACQLVIPVDPVTALDRAAPLFVVGGPVEFHGYYSSLLLARSGLATRLAAVGSATFVLHTIDGEDTEVDEAVVDALLGIVGEDLVCVDWRCDWPDAMPGYNGVQLTVNGVGNLHDDDPEHVPGATAVYLTVHPRSARDAAAFAARMSGLAGVRLRTSWE